MILWIIILLCFVYLLIVYIKQKSFKIKAIIGCILSFILELVFVSYFLKMNFFVICILCVLGCWYILIMNLHHVPWHLRTMYHWYIHSVTQWLYCCNWINMNTVLFLLMIVWFIVCIIICVCMDCWIWVLFNKCYGHQYNSCSTSIHLKQKNLCRKQIYLLKLKIEKQVLKHCLEQKCELIWNVWVCWFAGILYCSCILVQFLFVDC